ncbi:hypothetical protein J6TS2_09260 [Heyndrickxia sporothermodurans]|nr:hypothetical protein J6TS2_09260 [Heyndrickxia sporothermodurans]
MKSMVRKLYEITKIHPLQEKWLIVDSYQTGEQILLSYTKANYRAINLKISTLKEAANTIMDLHLVATIEKINDSIGTLLIHSILKDLKNQNRLRYINKLELTPSLSRAIFHVMNHSRLSEIKSNNFPIRKFNIQEKALDFQKILHAYEQKLRQMKLLDDAEIFHQAINLAERHMPKKCVFIFQPNLTFLSLEEKLVQILFQQNSYILPIAPVFGVESPSRMPLIKDAVGKATDLSSIYIETLNRPKDKKEIKFFTGQTEEHELFDVLRKIKQNNSSFDSCSVFYSKRDPFHLIMYQISERLNIPVTFGEGIPISITNPGKMVSLLLLCLKTNFHVTSFLTLFKEGVLELGDSSPSLTSIITMLRNSEIGWEKEHYLRQFQKQINFINKMISIVNEKDQKELLKSREGYIWLKAWFTQIFQQVTKHDLKSYLHFIRFFLTNYLATPSPMDELAKKSLLEQIALIFPYAIKTDSINEMCKYLEELLLTIHIGASNPKPGAIHITSYKRGIFIDRENLYFVGFDQRSFPGSIKEDPFLLDSERKAINSRLPLQRENAKESLFHVLQLLACTNGIPTISYSVFDLQEGRSNRPSHFYLKCYQYQTGDYNSDIETIHKKYVECSKIPFIVNKEWWEKKIFEKNRTIPNGFQHLIKGQEAKMARLSPFFTEYEGKISPVVNIDPRKNNSIRMSSSKLEKLATCPYKYFLEDVLQVSPVEDIEFHRDMWLDNQIRGLLLHEIFEEFYTTIKEWGHRPKFMEHEKLLIEIASAKITNRKKKYPPPNRHVFEQEVSEIFASCKIFLKTEEMQSDDQLPIQFEYSFGMGEEPPALITLLTGESFQLSGKIDRVDQHKDSSLSIIDYKTGKPSSFHQKKYFNGGRQLQHFLYAIALENKLELINKQVKISSYLFPTTKGIGERKDRMQDSVTRKNGMDILERSLDVLKVGSFIMTDDAEKDCTYCDYKSVCKRTSYTKEIYEAKGMDHNATGINRWKGIRAYE